MLAQGFVWLASVVLVVLTLLPLYRSPRWWIRLWDYPRLQIAIALAAMVPLQLAIIRPVDLRLGLLAITLACLAWQVSRIYPYTRLYPPEVTVSTGANPERKVRILIANVLQENRRTDLFLQCIRNFDPDIVLAVETNAWWDSQIAVLQHDYPAAVRHPLENTYGMVLFSRLGLSNVTVRDRMTEGIPSIRAEVTLGSGQPVTLHCVHPEPPQVGNDVEERDAELVLVAREAARDRSPTIVCGDLNDVAWSHTTRLFQRISHLLDPRVGRGLYSTFHASYWFARWPLDHVFHDASFRLSRLEVLPFFGSDHFPVLVELVHDPSAVRDHDPPASSEEDRREADAIVDEAKQ